MKGIIYKLTNKLNGLIYVGQTRGTLEARLRCHFSSPHYFGRALRKHGLDNFQVEIIDTASTRQSLDKKEKYWISTFNSIAPGGYNLTPGGWGVSNPSQITRKNMSDGQKRRVRSAEEIARMTIISRKVDRTRAAYRKTASVAALNRWAKIREQEIVTYLKG